MVRSHCRTTLSEMFGLRVSLNRLEAVRTVRIVCDNYDVQVFGFVAELGDDLADVLRGLGRSLLCCGEKGHNHDSAAAVFVVKRPSCNIVGRKLRNLLPNFKAASNCIGSRKGNKLHYR